MSGYCLGHLPDVGSHPKRRSLQPRQPALNTYLHGQLCGRSLYLQRGASLRARKKKTKKKARKGANLEFRVSSDPVLDVNHEWHTCNGDVHLLQHGSTTCNSFF